jgi:iron-sulfur cluster assembly protein
MNYEGYDWIKVKKYEMDESLSWEERYKQLEEHYKAETTFLIDKVRELAAQAPAEPESESPITITDIAMSEVKKVMEEQDLQDHHLRIGVAGGGCSGFQYSLGFEAPDKISNADKVYQKDGIKFVVDKKSAIYLDGVTLDFHQDINKRGFVFDNPRAKGSCGCGSSFSV